MSSFDSKAGSGSSGFNEASNYADLSQASQDTFSPRSQASKNDFFSDLGNDMVIGGLGGAGLGGLGTYAIANHMSYSGAIKSYLARAAEPIPELPTNALDPITDGTLSDESANIYLRFLGASRTPLGPLTDVMRNSFADDAVADALRPGLAGAGIGLAAGLGIGALVYVLDKNHLL